MKILNKLSSFSDLYGSNSIEAAKIDMILDTVQEYMDTMAVVRHASEETKVSVNDGISKFREVLREVLKTFQVILNDLIK